MLRFACISLCVASAAFAETSPPDSLSEEERAAKQSENPISATSHVVVENSASYLIGPLDRTLEVVTLTPILPIDLDADWTLITNARIPLVWAPDPTTTTGRAFGLGDIIATPLVGPKSHSNFFFGIGFSARFPTASNRSLGGFDSGQLSIGPAATVAVTPGHFVVGASLNQQWSVVGRDDARKLSGFLLQPILNYNLPQAWYLTSSPYILCDWTADNDKCLVPVGGGIGRLSLLPPKTLPPTAALAFEIHAYWNVIRADVGPAWSLRFQMTLSIPK